jgi:hypothetical protein
MFRLRATEHRCEKVRRGAPLNMTQGERQGPFEALVGLYHVLNRSRMAARESCLNQLETMTVGISAKALYRKV